MFPRSLLILLFYLIAQHEDVRPPSALSWNVHHVHEYLCARGLPVEADIMRANSIHGTALVSLRRDSLDMMGIRDNGRQNSLLAVVSELREKVLCPLFLGFSNAEKQGTLVPTYSFL